MLPCIIFFFWDLLLRLRPLTHQLGSPIDFFRPSGRIYTGFSQKPPLSLATSHLIDTVNDPDDNSMKTQYQLVWRPGNNFPGLKKKKINKINQQSARDFVATWFYYFIIFPALVSWSNPKTATYIQHDNIPGSCDSPVGSGVGSCSTGWTYTCSEHSAGLPVPPTLALARRHYL